MQADILIDPTFAFKRESPPRARAACGASARRALIKD
jgi:hypothetical protein